MPRPKGSLNDKPWKDAIRKAVARRSIDGGRTLDRLAESLVSKGITGDVSALTEIGNRLDGKAVQQIDAHVTHERMVVNAPEPVATSDEWTEKNAPVTH